MKNVPIQFNFIVSSYLAKTSTKYDIITFCPTKTKLKKSLKKNKLVFSLQPDVFQRMVGSLVIEILPKKTGNSSSS
jgi:hypothetical protein